jgi:tetratricopeptide (TPR) repeat protein
MKRRILGASLLAVLVFTGITAAYAQSASPEETLKQYVADLQKNPDDTALREKIIKLALEMRPSPKVPDEVDELVGQATYIFKTAKSEADFAEAAKAYQKVLLIAPWVPDYYFNLGTVQEKAGKLADAVASFKLYLLAAPNAEDARSVRQRIGVLKYQAQKETEEAAAQAERERQEEESRQARAAAAERERRTKEEMLSRIDLSGMWVVDSCGNGRFGYRHYEFEVVGDKISMFEVTDKLDNQGTRPKGTRTDSWTATLNGQEFTGTAGVMQLKGVIAYDNKSVDFIYDNDPRKHWHLVPCNLH